MSEVDRNLSRNLSRREKDPERISYREMDSLQLFFPHYFSSILIELCGFLIWLLHQFEKGFHDMLQDFIINTR